MALVKPTFHEIFMGLAHQLARRSHCVKKKVGAVLVKDTHIIATGYNGLPSGTYNCDEKWPKEGCPRSRRGGCSLSLHAEQNAILRAAKQHQEMQGATLYVTLAPCLACARIIYTMGISNVFYAESYAAYKGIDQEEGVIFLQTFGIAVEQYPSSTVSRATKPKKNKT